MVKRPHRQSDGYFHINGKVFPNLFGSRKMVYTYKTAYKTRGNLTEKDLMKNKSGEIVSRKKHFTAKKENRLVKNGYGTKKGKFGWVRRNVKKGRRTRRMRGGSAEGAPEAPAVPAQEISAANAEGNIFKSGPSPV